MTVSANPTVDQLAACIGLTLLLNKMDKHATAIFSGKVPSTLEFLQPEKTIETNTDSLQDFIISLDKNKADKLRYKVEDQVVRIFITPYRTSIGEKDLMFSHGDFNVEVVIALGIKNRTQIDQAIAAHGRILHDATVISINNGPGTAPQLGQLNWQDPAASSLCEMLVSISEAFGAGLLDNQMATAFLTGIVAETARFSNPKTSPKVMTMAAQLMAAGANQQLIVSKLEPPPPPPPKIPPQQPPKAPPPTAPTPPEPKKKDSGSLNVSHEKNKADSPEVEIAPNEIRIDRQGNLLTPEDLLKKQAKGRAPAPEPPLPMPPPPPPEPVVTPPPAPEPQPVPIAPIQPVPELPKPAPPTLPEITPAHRMMDPRDHLPNINPPFAADMQSEWIDPYNSTSIDPLSGRDSDNGGMHTENTPAVAATAAAEVDEARSAVQNALSAAPFDAAAAGPLTALNAQPAGPELHPATPPVAPNDTPSLTLPPNGNGSMGTVTPYMPPADTPAAPAPPPNPPPLPIPSNPGAMLPTNPTYQPPTS